MLPIIGAGMGATVGIAAGAQWLGGRVLQMGWTVNLPEPVRRNTVPITAAVVTLAGWTGLRTSKKMQKWSLPFLMGGMAATAVHLLIYSKWGQDIALRAGLPLTVAAPMATRAAAEAAANGNAEAATSGLASYHRCFAVPG